MNFLRGVLAAAVSLVGTVACFVAAYRWAGKDFGGVAMFGCLYASALILGAVHGLVWRRRYGVAASVVALVGALVSWVPVTVGSMGRALFEVPFVAMYALVVFVGVQVVARKMSADMRQHIG